MDDELREEATGMLLLADMTIVCRIPRASLLGADDALLASINAYLEERGRAIAAEVRERWPDLEVTYG
jgi:hypothetical protein